MSPFDIPFRGFSRCLNAPCLLNLSALGAFFFFPFESFQLNGKVFEFDKRDDMS